MADRCQACQGITFLISYWLVTHERNYVRRQRLPFADPGELWDFKRAMAAAPKSDLRQEVLSAAEPCYCKPKRSPEEDEAPRARGRKERQYAD